MAATLLVLRIKGQINLPYWVVTTFKLLKLEKKYSATIVHNKKSMLGMLNKIKNYICWKEADFLIVKELLYRRALKKGHKKFIDDDALQLGFNNVDDLVNSIIDGKTSLSKTKILKPWFALSPPRHGFKKSTKTLCSERGILGYNSDLNTIIRNMM